jgi:Na+-translocating ferredoxin:NAD+ oxidoreductase RnfD subunit
MNSTLPIVLVMAVVGLVVALFLARVVLGGVLRLAFHRARTLVRRVLNRRKVEREEPDRRQANRRD